MWKAILGMHRRCAEAVALAQIKVAGICKAKFGVSLETAIEDTLATVFGQGTPKFNRYYPAANLEPVPNLRIVPDWRGYGGGGDDENLPELRQGIADRKRIAVALLEEAVRGLEEEIKYHPPELTVSADDATRQQQSAAVGSRNVFIVHGHDDATRQQQSAAVGSRKVFIVHGHDEGTREAVARFVEKLGFDPIILHERPNRGRTIITKFREEAAGVGFAIVLMTADDLGRSIEYTELKPRARQNVIFELGFFIGALRPEHVAALVKGNIDLPSDYDGVVYISMD